MKSARIITSEVHDPQLEKQAEWMIFGTPKERLDFYRREIQYETSLLAGRTNAYLTAQSFLVIAYASSMANSNENWGALFTLVVPALFTLLGIINSLHAWPGIRASATIIEHWHYKQVQLLHSDPEFGHAYDDSPPVQRAGGQLGEHLQVAVVLSALTLAVHRVLERAGPVLRLAAVTFGEAVSRHDGLIAPAARQSIRTSVCCAFQP
jgi:hypothetical protein